MRFKRNAGAAAEAARMAGYATILYFLVRLFFWSVQRGMGTAQEPDEFILFGAIGLFAAGFLAAYVYYLRAMETGRAAYYVIPYRSLAGLEEQMNIRGDQGFLCEDAKPDVFLFKWRPTGERYSYKVEYVSVRDALRFKKFVSENREQGWDYVPSSNSLGDAQVSVFRSAGKAAAFKNADRHSRRRLRGWLAIVVVLDILAAAFAVMTAVYILPEVAVARRFAAAISTICILQIGIKLKLIFLPEK